MTLLQKLMRNAVERQRELLGNWLIKHSEICNETPSEFHWPSGMIELECERGHSFEVITHISTTFRAVNGPYSIQRTD